MIVREIVLTCSNPHVARARCFYPRRFRATLLARRDKRNLMSGVFAAGLVRRFSRRAGNGDWEGVGEATRGADQPILSGLRYILERGRELNEGDSDPDPLEDWRVPTPSFSRCEAWRH